MEGSQAGEGRTPERITRRAFVQRSLVAGVALGGTGELLAACGSGSSEAASGMVQVLVGFGTGNAPEQIPTQKALAEAFHRANSRASVNFLRIPDSDQAARKFGLLLASHRPPDVVLPTGLSGISTYLDQNVWLDLAPYLDKDGVSLDDFQPPARLAAQPTAYFGSDAKAVVGIPSGMFSHAVAYNKDLFAAAGIPEPPHKWDTPEWNYDRLLEIATALTRDEKGRTPDKPGFDSGRIAQFGLGHWDTGIMILGFGAHNYDPGTRKVLFDTPEYERGLQFGIDLTNRHHVLATDELAAGVAAGTDPQLAAWQRGKVAMVDICTCDLPSYGVGNRFRWDVAAWPTGPRRLAATLNLDVGAVVRPGARHDTAWSLLRYLLTEPDHERRLATRGYGAIPPLKRESAAFGPYIKRRFPGIDLRVFLDAINHGTDESEAWYPAFAKINDLGGQYLQPVYDGKASAAEALPKYQAAAQREVDSWFAQHKLPSSG